MNLLFNGKAWWLSIGVTLSVMVTLLSCAPGPISQKRASISDYCAPSLRYVYDTSYLPKPEIQSVLQADANLRKRYSQHDLLLANAAGILPLLQQLIHLEADTTVAGRLLQVQIRQQITHRLLLAATEIDSFAAELDCEGERAEQLAAYLDRKDARRVRNLTISSVVIGAITTVVTSLVQANNANKTAAIGGGLISASLGGLAAFSANRSVQLLHNRNLLTDIWNQPVQSTIYPPFVWYVLNEKLFSNTGQNPIRYNIRQRWQDYVLNGTTAEQQALYFGTGGAYQADDLHTRANMLNQLQSSLRSINQDLQSLLLALSN